MKSTPLRVKSSKRTRKLTTDLQENESDPAESSAGALCHCGTVREPQTPDRSPKEIRRMEWERARNCQGVFKITPVGKHRKSPRRRPASRSPGLRVPAETERALRQGSRPLRPDPPPGGRKPWRGEAKPPRHPCGRRSGSLLLLCGCFRQAPARSWLGQPSKSPRCSRLPPGCTQIRIPPLPLPRRRGYCT